MSSGEATFLLHCKAYGLPKPEREYRFRSPRRFRFDFAWPRKKIAVEIEGGLYSAGRHVRGRGYEKDLVKYNLAVLLGWRVLRYSTKMVESGEAVREVDSLFRYRSGMRVYDACTGKESRFSRPVSLGREGRQ